MTTFLPYLFKSPRVQISLFVVICFYLAPSGCGSDAQILKFKAPQDLHTHVAKMDPNYQHILVQLGAPSKKQMESTALLPGFIAFHQQPDGSLQGVFRANREQSLDPETAFALTDANDHVCGQTQFMLNNTALLGDFLGPEFRYHVRVASVANLLDQVNGSAIRDHAVDLAALATRHHKSTVGARAPQLVETKFLSAANGITGFSTRQVTHTTFSTLQNSVIATILGSSKPDEIVILGAHLDSVNANGGRTSPNSVNAPGMDDNASGIGAITEVLRLLKQAGGSFSRTIEIHAYAGEEGGLLGSGEIASLYKAQGKKVVAMLNLDMTSYAQDPASAKIYIVPNSTSKEASRGLRDLLNAYLDGNYQSIPLTAGSSDHASWHLQGFHSAFSFEHPVYYNKNLHTLQDSSFQNTPLSARFAKLAAAFVLHNAGWSTAASEYAQALVQSGSSLKNTDIKVAILKPKADGTNYIAIAGASSWTAIDVCYITETGATGCKREREELDSTGVSKNGRTAFVTQIPFSLQEKARVRIMAYDEADRFVAERNLRFTARK